MLDVRRARNAVNSESKAAKAALRITKGTYGFHSASEFPVAGNRPRRRQSSSGPLDKKTSLQVEKTASKLSSNNGHGSASKKCPRRSSLGEEHENEKESSARQQRNSKMGEVGDWFHEVGLSHAIPAFTAAGIVTPTAIAELEAGQYVALGLTEPDDLRKFFFLQQMALTGASGAIGDRPRRRRSSLGYAQQQQPVEDDEDDANLQCDEQRNHRNHRRRSSMGRQLFSCEQGDESVRCNSRENRPIRRGSLGSDETKGENRPRRRSSLGHRSDHQDVKGSEYVEPSKHSCGPRRRSSLGCNQAPARREEDATIFQPAGSNREHRPRRRSSHERAAGEGNKCIDPKEDKDRPRRRSSLVGQHRRPGTGREDEAVTLSSVCRPRRSSSLGQNGNQEVVEDNGHMDCVQQPVLQGGEDETTLQFNFKNRPIRRSSLGRNQEATEKYNNGNDPSRHRPRRHSSLKHDDTDHQEKEPRRLSVLGYKNYHSPESCYRVDHTPSEEGRRHRGRRSSLGHMCDIGIRHRPPSLKQEICTRQIEQSLLSIDITGVRIAKKTASPTKTEQPWQRRQRRRSLEAH